MDEDRQKELDEEYPEKAAAEGREGARESHEEEGTDNELLDSEQHSDAPGPFGTG